MKLTLHEALRSPCISQCCLDDADICVGCKRHINEITGWHGANTEQRRTVLKRCVERGNLTLPENLDNSN